jgi:hypothetical protein
LAGEGGFGEQQQGFFIDIDFQLIDGVVVLFDFVGGFVVAVNDGCDGFFDDALGFGGHIQQGLFEGVEFLVEVLQGVGWGISRSDR